MLRSTRQTLSAIALIFAVSAPAAYAGPAVDWDFGTQIRAQIEAVLESLGNLFDLSSSEGFAPQGPTIEATAENVTPGFVPNGLAQSQEEEDDSGVKDPHQPTQEVHPGFIPNG